ncbi:ankyrin repeat domain-containing protein [Neorickettsia helminthoeca]|uniref:ankyrin repeat domain-containing protein n=1 Tax=Neorickettsia helminthoeca TaxID=33994 RepID=UPI0005704020|nr:ankyrin repeat domain-containing protein [Neorickettsia helminthoeca]
MQSYKDLLRDIKDGNSSSFERIFRGWPFDCSGYSYGAPPLFNAVASSICEDSKADDIRIQELLHAQPPGYEQAVEAAKERISGREKILQLLCNHLQVAHLINASDLRSGLTPIQIALEANDTNLINTLFRKGVNPASKLKVGGVEHCTLFMKALDCAEEGRSVELLEGVARGSTSRKLFESEPGEKARHKIKSQFMEYILGLNENYKISLPVLYSSSGACKNIFHSIIEKKDTRALSWLKRLLLSENPIIEEVEKISKELGLPADLADRILKDTKESNAGFVKHRSKTCAADLILNSPAMEYSPLELSLKTLSAPEELPFVMQVPIKKIDGKGYKTVGEALEEVGSEEAHHVLRACVKFATPNLLKDLFLGDKGRARLDVLCELHMDGDGKITDQKCISVLASNAPEKLAGLVRESTVEVGKALPVLAIYGTPQVLQGIEAHITTEALKKENADGLNALEVAITSGNHTFAEWILTKLENDLNSLAGGELISLQNKTDRILAKAHKESGGNLLHLAAQHAPQLLKQILRLSTNSNHLLGSKDSKGLLAAHYQTSEKSLLDGLKPLIEERLERPVQEAELKADVELHAAIANGDKSALEKLFILKSENVYKVIDTVDGGKSILEVAAESKQPDLVRYILQEHKKLQAKSQNECKEIEIQLSAIEGMQQQQGMEAKIRELRMAKEQKSELQQSRGKMLSQQASKTVLGVLSKQAESSWHVDILGMADSLADLSEDEYVASALDASMNPVVTAIQSGNNPVAEKILAASPRFADESLKELLVEKGSGNGLLKYGFGVSALYDRRYSPPEKSESKIQFDVSAAAENVVRSETEKYRSAVSDRFMGKGVLLPYAHAVSKDTNSAENLKDKLNDIKDGDPTLLSVQSADGHNLGTLIAAFGNIAQWKSYANKYKKLKASDKGDPSPIGDMSAKIGSPAQAVLLAKYFAHSDDMRRHKDLMFDHFMIHYPQSTLLQNGEGDNLLHTIVRCEDLDALQAVMEHDSHTIQDLISGLKQRNNGGKSVLELALHLNNAAMLKCIIENSMARGGTDAACSLLLDCRLLHDAVLNGNRVMVKLLAELQRMLNIALSPGECTWKDSWILRSVIRLRSRLKLEMRIY